MPGGQTGGSTVGVAALATGSTGGSAAGEELDGDASTPDGAGWPSVRSGCAVHAETRRKTALARSSIRTVLA